MKNTFWNNHYAVRSEQQLPPGGNPRGAGCGPTTSPAGTPAGTPALASPDIPELTLQSRCFLWAWNTYPEHRQMLFHVQNKARNRIEGAKFKAMGVVKGVSDMILIGPGRVVFVELKTGTGSQSSDQREFERKVTERGHMYVVVRDEDAFRNLVSALWGPATYFSAPGVIKGVLSFEHIEDTVCEFYDVDKTHIYDRNRTAALVWPRNVIAYFAIELLHMTLMEVGTRMNRDHTTILWSRRQVQNRKHCEQLFSSEVEEIRRRLKMISY